MFENIGLTAMKEGAERLQRYMASVDTDLKQLGEVFNENFTKYFAQLDLINQRLDRIEQALKGEKK